MITSVKRDPRPVAPAAREVALRGAGVAGLLVQPAEPVGDLGLVLRGRPTVGFAVGRDRAVQVAVADPRRRDVPPGGVGRRRLRQLEDGRPARDRLRLVVEPVVGLAEAEQRRGGDRRVVEADDARRSAARASAKSPEASNSPPRWSNASAASRVSLPVAPGSSGAGGGGASSIVRTILDLRACADGSPSNGPPPSWPRSSARNRSPTTRAERYNVAPTDEAAVVVQREDRRAVTAYRWGLIPHWAKEAKVGSRMFNARAETITTSPAFRDAFVRKRCLVPVDSFYEWKREGTIRQPYRVVRRDGAPLALAGLWAGWRDPATETVRRTFTIITTTPNEALADLHDRMPVVIDDGRLGSLARPVAAGSRRAPRPARPERGRRARRLRGRALRQRRPARRPRADRAARLRP